MVRNFSERPIAPEVLDRILWAGCRAPSAGNAQGLDLVVLEGADQTERFWRCTFTAERRGAFRWQGLFAAPVIVVPYADPEAYLARYAEPDKHESGLGEGTDRWPVPYWFTDAAMAVENMLLAAVEEGLGALFFGVFRGEDALAAELGVPPSRRPVGALAFGHALDDERGRSATRPRRSVDAVVHRGGW
jgi:nitroreductase